MMKEPLNFVHQWPRVTSPPAGCQQDLHSITAKWIRPVDEESSPVVHSVKPRRLSFHLCVHYLMHGECSANVGWIEWWMNKWMQSKWGWKKWPKQRISERRGWKQREVLVWALKKKTPQVCGFSPTSLASLTSTAQAFLILQPQEFIFSLLSLFVLLNISLPFAFILLLVLNWCSCFSFSTRLLSLLNIQEPFYPQTWCSSPPSIQAFRILLKDSSFPYRLPHNPGALPSLPESSSWNSHLKKVGIVELGQETVLNASKCHHKEQTWHARVGVESPNILWIMRLWEVREGWRREERRRKGKKGVQKEEDAVVEERGQEGEKWLDTIHLSSLVTTPTKSPVAQVIIDFSVPNSADHSTSCNSFRLASRSWLVYWLSTCFADGFPHLVHSHLLALPSLLVCVP